MNRAAIAGLSVALLGGVAGCGSGASHPASTAGGREVLVGHVQPVHAGSLTAAQVAADDTTFGFALFHRLCAAAPTTNLVISPASAAEALGLLDAGSVGKTRVAVSRLLSLPGWTPAVVAALHDQAAELAKVSQVTVTNHVYEQTGVHPTQQTLNDLATAFSANLEQLDFTKEPAATDAINSEISHDTAGLIPTLFSQPLDGSTQTVLANAVLLDAKWQDPFPSSTPQSFRTAAGKTVTTPLMDNSEGSFATRSSGGWQSVVLPYAGDKLQAVAILPPTTGTTPTTCQTPSAATLTALTSGASTGDGVVLPKLNLSQELSLGSVLASMGLPLNGDYSGLGAQDSAISQVVQKVVMKVDEKGTKAAAATGVAIATSIRVENQVVTFDRPFLLVLEDTATHTPLFLAQVSDPTQQ